MHLLPEVLVLVLCISIASCLPIGPGFSDFVATAELSSEQLVQNCNQDFTGSGVCSLIRNSDTSSIRCQLSYNVENVTSIELREGAAGTEGNILFSFIFGEEDDDNDFYVQQEFFLDEDDDDSEEADFLSGNWFLLIRSIGCNSGSIRGQLTNGLNVYSVLEGNNEPEPTGSNSKGVAVTDYNILNQRLNSFIQFDTESVITAQLLQAVDNNDPGNIFFTYSDRTSPIDQSVQYITPRETELYRRQHFYNINSARAPTGEIRGQLRVIDATPDINYAFLLRSADGSSRRAGAQVSLLCSGEIEYFISHDLDIVNAYVVGDNGDPQVLFTLNGVRSPIIGKQALSNEEVELLLRRNMIIILEDASGERFMSEIIPEFPFYAYISGSQELPRVSSFARGLALFGFNENENQLTYHFFHNLQNIDTIQIREGSFGVTGGLEIQFDEFQSSSFGIVQIDNNQLQLLVRQLLYIRMEGEVTIRGQILFNGVENCFEELQSSDESTSYTGYYISSRYFSPSSSSSRVHVPLLLSIAIAMFYLLYWD